MPTTSIIHLQNVCKHLKQSKILDNITFNVPRTEIFGLLGPSGSGKTTLVKLMAGIDCSTSGDVHVLGKKLPNLKMFSKIGYMAQSDALYAELTALENLQFFAALFGLSGRRKQQRIREVMELVDLNAYLNQQVSNYSGGMKRRLSLAVSLLHEPEILILDEPTVGIDPMLRQSIWKEFDKLSAKGTTIIVTTHVMDEAERCHRLGMIREGRLIAIGSLEQLKRASEAVTIEQVFLHYGGASS